MEYRIFEALVVAHILTGSLGALTFWMPVLGAKGTKMHRLSGRVFVFTMLLTGTFAIGMSVLTLLEPMGTHPHLVGKFDADFVRGIFGWLMLHLGILTINLAWYGWLCARNRAQREPMREWRNLALQPLLLIAAINCAAQGWLINQPLMLGVSVIGIATVLTNVWFLYKPTPGAMDWLKEHVKALIGAGISVYTAFLAFGSVRAFPELALSPIMWAVPAAIGIAFILWHWRRIDRKLRSQKPRVS